MKLDITINIKNERKIILVPGIISGPNTALSSKISASKTLPTVLDHWDFVSQKACGIKKIEIKAEIQLNGKLINKILAWGSKEENRFPIYTDKEKEAWASGALKSAADLNSTFFMKKKIFVAVKYNVALK